jgi:RsiW-degrading membrane proteinase PrsW (M82 family)
LPGVLLLAYILWTDRKNSEPWLLIVKGVVCGIISLGILRLFWSYLPDYFTWAGVKDTIIERVRYAFLYAAIPEEIAKLIMLWVVVSRNTFYNEPRDGIVYAVCVGLGFATLENIGYVTGHENWGKVAFARAMLSVPAHYLCAVLMGYYYANARFWPSRGARRYWQLARIILIPVLIHGTFDSMAFVISWNQVALYVFAFIFLILVGWIHHHCNQLSDRQSLDAMKD